MNTLEKRMLLFTLGCIPLRLYLVYLAKTRKDLLAILSMIAMVIGIGFLYIYITNSRKSGIETFNQPIYWDSLRPIHGILYLTFSYNAYKGNTNAWKYLLIDVIIGIIGFLTYHSKG